MLPFIFILLLIIPPITSAELSGNTPYDNSIPTGSWILSHYRDSTGVMIPPINSTDITANFSQDGALSGISGCNSYYSMYTHGSGAILIAPATTTNLSCEEEKRKQEKIYLNALKNVALAERNETMLRLFDDEEELLVEYKSILSIENNLTI